VSGRDPLGLFGADRAAFDACLDRLETIAGQSRPELYGPLDNQADWATASKFIHGGGWDLLTHAQQVGYSRRLAFIKRKFRGSR
jgi:hypothetical protein